MNTLEFTLDNRQEETRFNAVIARLEELLDKETDSTSTYMSLSKTLPKLKRKECVSEREFLIFKKIIQKLEGNDIMNFYVENADSLLGLLETKLIIENTKNQVDDAQGIGSKLDSRLAYMGGENSGY